MTMTDSPSIEIREWGRPPRRVPLNRPIVVGREADETVSDDGVSRQHLRLVPSPTALSVVDLGSRNGTTVNGVALTGRAALQPGDVMRIGRTEIIVLPREQADPADGTPDHDATRLGLTAVTLPPPPPAPAIASRWHHLAERILGIDATGQRPLFPAYTEMTHKVPATVWLVARVISVGCYVALVLAMFVRPALGLFVFFNLVVPVLPLVLLVAPGLWRNICPLAASNQAPRVFKFGLGRTPPEWLHNNSYAIAAALFFGIAGSRLAGLDRHGAWMGTVLAVVLAAALLGGIVFKGKSGWCSSICPMFPIQRAYGQTPFVVVANAHCESCVGCAKNCYDFKPRAAYQADLADSDPGWSAARKLFAAALPGFVLGFFLLGSQPHTPSLQKFALLALFPLVTVGSFFVLDAVFVRVGAALLAVGYAAAALNLFYWFAGPVLAAALTQITGAPMGWLRWAITVVVAVVTVVWVARTRVVELQFAWATGVRPEPVLLGTPKVRHALPQVSAPRVCFEPGGVTLTADDGMSLLDIAEKGGLTVEAGCRMGVCGADPVAILDGQTCLSPPTQDELNTVRRLGLAPSTRMACCARISAGTVTVSLTPEPGGSPGPGATSAGYDRSIVSVVVIGNGIAGVTAADFVRRGHPDCEIHLIGQEPHALYNRMGISRLVYGRSAMQGLYLLPEGWYDEHGVNAWLNTVADRIDLRHRHIHLGTGEAIPYDRLILAMGARAARPPVEDLDRPGSFVLREAADASRIRAYSQQRGCRRAVVAGGGLLGLEAAWSLHLLGLQVTVLERRERLLSRQIDARCSELVAAHFARAGIEIERNVAAVRVLGTPDTTGVVLSDGRTLACEVVLSAVGNQPNVELARAAGIPVGRGILVDNRMQTQVPRVFAAGDVAEHAGEVPGLWPVAAEQAQAAAVNALGGRAELIGEVPATILKGVDLELFSIGRCAEQPGEQVIVIDHFTTGSYRRIVLSQGRIVGATVLGHHPADVAAAQCAVRGRLAVDPAGQEALRRGDWTVLAAKPVG